MYSQMAIFGSLNEFFVLAMHHFFFSFFFYLFLFKMSAISACSILLKTGAQTRNGPNGEQFGKCLQVL